MAGFAVEADTKEKEVTRALHSTNVLHDVVEYSRSRQVLNEEQTIVTLLIYVTGWLRDWHNYAGGVITGGSAGGKSHMKQEVVDSMFAYLSDALYSPTGMSGKAIIDDPDWDTSRVGALNELQKIPDEVLEFLKSAHGDDGGFDYRRDVADSSAHGGFKAAKIERDPKPVVFMLADENSMEVEQELRTRLIEVKVDENEEKNEAVHRMKWGHDHITLDSTDQEYVWEDEELWHSVRKHMQGLPEDLDVLIPTGDGEFPGDDWDAATVVGPMFNFKRSESTRASSMVASLVKASALLNYHAREQVEHNGKEWLVAEPVDVANIIACRSTLLALTHGLTEKKFAILDAILEVGGKASAGGTAVQAPKQDIIQAIQDNPYVATMTKTEVSKLLDEMDEHLILNKKDNPEDRRENLYVYDGAAAFEAPAIYEEYENFKDVMDPIREQPIEQTVTQQLEDLNAKLDSKTLAETGPSQDAESPSDGSDGDLSKFTDGDDPRVSELSDTAQNVAERLSEVLDDTWVPAHIMEANMLKTQHMVGATPVDESRETIGDERVTVVTPERQPNGGDYAHSVLDPGHSWWQDRDDIDDHNDTEKAIERAIEELRESGVLNITMDDEGNAHVTVEELK